MRRLSSQENKPPSAMETALLLGKGAKQNDVDAKSPLSSLVAAGSYVDVLKSDAAQELFRRLGNDATDVEREGLLYSIQALLYRVLMLPFKRSHVALCLSDF